MEKDIPITVEHSDDPSSLDKAAEVQFQDSEGKTKSWNDNKGFVQWAANPLQRKRGGSRPPPVLPKVVPADGFGEELNPDDMKNALPKSHVSESTGGFGEFMDPTLIEDVTSLPKVEKPQVAPQSPAVPQRSLSIGFDPTGLTSPRLNMDGLLKAAADLEDVEEDAQDVSDDDLDAFVGRIENDGLDDVDDADASEIINPLK